MWKRQTTNSWSLETRDSLRLLQSATRLCIKRKKCKPTESLVVVCAFHHWSQAWNAPTVAHAHKWRVWLHTLSIHPVPDLQPLNVSLNVGLNIVASSGVAIISGFCGVQISSWILYRCVNTMWKCEWRQKQMMSKVCSSLVAGVSLSYRSSINCLKKVPVCYLKPVNQTQIKSKGHVTVLNWMDCLGTQRSTFYNI